MEEQLRIIQDLRRQIDEINKIKIADENRYNEMCNSIDESLSNIQNMDKLLKESKEQFDAAKGAKIFKYSIPCGVGAAIATFVLLIIFEDFSNVFVNIFLSGICSVVSGSVVSCMPVMFLNGFNSFFIKRFPDIKGKYYKIQNIENSIMLTERNFNKMKKDRDILYTSLKSDEEILKSKLMELYDATEYYFSHLDDKDTCNYDNIITDTREASHRKKKIRTPQDSKNLNN